MNRRKNIDQQKRRRQSTLLVLMLAVIAFAILGRFIFDKESELDPEQLTLDTNHSEDILTSEAPTTLYLFPIHVSGAVNKPGVYYFSDTVIVSDAIAEAGGPTAEAASDALNMAAMLQPHSKIYVPSREEVEAAGSEFSFQSGEINNSGTASGKINLNLATEADLLTVPGIGPATASAILRYRDENGKFAQLEDLMQVSGIKEKKFASLEPYLFVP
ncbi:MAG: helix-hairpin-helix domain-containing protein [Eubacteriales bacterium]|nr:helix-hairpin-helix domain-containing protein [Eubacteriales bacterium]MDD4324214.1 helix-hairpin-helix domain-containing protein [Eubacteriales bacterium]MDD4541433.1 helix-hairpin-helix domain-containing protein [Eubacteriales bacterium]